MVAAESTFEIPEQEEISLVSLRKYANELDLRWWERWYLYALFLPVVRFGFKRMHIPAPSAMRPDGSIEFIEQIEAHFDEREATAACKSEKCSRFSPSRYSVKQLPFGVRLPDPSVQYKPHRNPLSILPDRYRRRYFPEPLETRHLAQLGHELDKLSRTLADA